MHSPAKDQSVRVIQPLGRGGTAEVVKACHLQSGREVAVKFARSDIDGPTVDFRRLARREYELIGGYCFPGLVQLEFDPAPTYDQLILEFCPGPSLDHAGRIDSLPLTLNIISALALDMEFLHAVGIIHGDLKPQNVFLPAHWKQLRSKQLFFVKLSDFSLGRRYNEPESARLGLGTVGYMAPECIRDRTTSARSDLFSLGVTAYQLLTGHHPFMDEDAEPVKVNSRVCEHTPVSLAALRPDLPEQVIAILNRLLAKQADLRPASGWEVCQALRQAGAEYPYAGAMRPAFLFRPAVSYDKFCADHLALTGQQKDLLDELTDRDTANLRLLLTANLVRGRLSYTEGRFRFITGMYWPRRLRFHVLKQFAAATWSVRKKAVTAAVLGGNDALRRLTLTRGVPQTLLPHATPGLLLHLLRSRTVRHISARLAPLADRNEAHDVAAHLHLQAGNLAEAERCADLAATRLAKESRNQDAMALIRKLDRYARTSGREYEIRRVLKLKGNIHKDSGELDHAERTYLRVIGLYEGRTPDKLLAETYKYLGDLYRLRQDSKAALEALEKSLAVFRDLGDELEISHTLTNIGNVYWLGNDTRRALTQYRAAYKIQKRLDAKPDMASTLHNIGSIFCLDGRLKRGIFLLNYTLSLKKEIGHLGEIARTLNNLGYAYQLTGSPTRAAEMLAEALDINRRIGSKKEILYNLENLVSLRIAAGQLKESSELLAESLSIAQSNNLLAHECSFHLHMATIAKRMGRYGEAARSLATLDRILTELDDPTMQLLADVQKASIKQHLGGAIGALELAQKVYGEAVRTRNVVAELESLLLLAKLTDDSAYWDVANAVVDERHLRRERRILWFSRLDYMLDRGRIDEAMELSAGVLHELDDPEADLERAWMHNVAGIVELNRQQRSRAAVHFQAAEHLARKSGLAPELITALTMSGQIAKIEGDFEKAYGAFHQALRLCRQVAEEIADEQDRKRFLDRPVVQSLAHEIKALGANLGQKERADH